MNLKKVFSILPSVTAYAHCDVPCGIYDPKPAQIAAATVLKMVTKIKELEYPKEPKSQEAMEYGNNLIRMTWTKEEHARKCKEEVLILWTDYFKSEHLEMFPDLHDIFWQTAKLCSQAKQHVDMKIAEDLVASVDKIAVMFQKAEEAKKKTK